MAHRLINALHRRLSKYEVVLEQRQHHAALVTSLLFGATTCV
jgi:hypothetical protein